MSRRYGGNFRLFRCKFSLLMNTKHRQKMSYLTCYHANPYIIRWRWNMNSVVKFTYVLFLLLLLLAASSTKTCSRFCLADFLSYMHQKSVYTEFLFIYLQVFDIFAFISHINKSLSLLRLYANIIQLNLNSFEW